MQEIESDEITQETIDKFIADFETKLNAAEADKAEQAENAPSPEQFEAMMEECAAFTEALNAELDANVRKAIEEAIQSIETIRNFETTAQGNSGVKAAMDKVAALEEILDNEVLPLLSK